MIEIGSMMSSPSKLYVGDLSSICSEESLFQEFSQFGTVTDVHVQRCRKTNSSLCYGFVFMSNALEAQNAIRGLNGVLLLGRRLKVRGAEVGPVAAEAPVYPVCFKFSGLVRGRSTDEVRLREVFGRYGEIDDISIRKTFMDAVSCCVCVFV